MKKLTHVNRELENIIDDVKRENAHNYILKLAYQLNVSSLKKDLDSIVITENEVGEKIERTEFSDAELAMIETLRTTIDSYNEGINELTPLLSDFKPTMKDVRILRLVAYANTDELSEINNVRFGKSVIKVGKSREDSLLGFTALSNAMELFKDAQRNNSDNSKAYKSAISNLVDVFQRFLDWNYAVDNAAEGTLYHSNVFGDFEFKVTEKFVKYMASLSCFETKITKGDMTETFSRERFYQSFAAWFFIALTKGNKFEKRYTAPAIIKMDTVEEPVHVEITE